MTTTAKKTNGVMRLPENLRAQVSARMRSIREANSLYKHDVEFLSRGTINTYEKIDPSPMRLGDMYHLASTYGMSLQEFVETLFSRDEGNLETIEARALARSIMRLDRDKAKILRAMMETLEEL